MALRLLFHNFKQLNGVNMKLILASLITFAALLANAQYPYPQSYTTCKVEYTGNYYYVSKDGQRFTELVSSLQQAISQQQQLENSGMCAYSNVSPGKCQLEYTGNYYYVSRNGNRVSELVSGYQSALNTRDQLYQSRNCDQTTYQITHQCKVEYTGNYYYVSRGGNRFSELVSSLDQATRTRDDLARNYVCQVQYQTASCKLEYTGNYYYLSINSTRASELVSDLNQALNQQRGLYDRGMCGAPQAESCTIAYTGNYYYVARNGNRLSELVSDLNRANNTLQQLRYSRNCY